jgi:ribosome-binding factor A
MEQARIRRLNSLIKERMATIIHTELAGKAKAVISVTRVDTAPDLSNAKIYISILGKTESAEQKSLELLKQKAKYFRYLLSQDITIRHTPEIIFKQDDSIATGSHVIDIINDLDHDD